MTILDHQTPALVALAALSYATFSRYLISSSPVRAVFLIAFLSTLEMRSTVRTVRVNLQLAHLLRDLIQASRASCHESKKGRRWLQHLGGELGVSLKTV
jgi:hypothetical protein